MDLITVTLLFVFNMDNQPTLRPGLLPARSGLPVPRWLA
jgi:hypothetical protein